MYTTTVYYAVYKKKNRRASVNMFHMKHQNEEKMWLTFWHAFDSDMVVGAGWAGLSISETADLSDFHMQQPIEFTHNGVKKQKISSDWQLCREK